MSAELLKLLKRSVGSKLTTDLAADIYVAAGRNKHDDLVRERDELLAALRGLMIDPDGTYRFRFIELPDCVRTAREILDKYPKS